MSSRKIWTNKEKHMIVQEGLKGEVPLGELCAKYGIAQSMYYKWRDVVLSHGHEVFDRSTVDQRIKRYEDKIKHLQQVIGEQAIELKKNDW